MNTQQDEHDEVVRYAEDLRSRGYHDVDVYRYRASLDNRDEWRQDHAEARGYAVTYTGSPPAWQYDTPFHDRSFTVFCGESGIPHERLIKANILADIPGRDVTPYWTAAWTTEASLIIAGMNTHNVIMKRFTPHEGESVYAWRIGPRPTFHLIMDKEDRIYSCCPHCADHSAAWFGSETLTPDGKGHTVPCAHCQPIWSTPSENCPTRHVQTLSDQTCADCGAHRQN